MELYNRLESRRTKMCDTQTAKWDENVTNMKQRCCVRSNKAPCVGFEINRKQRDNIKSTSIPYNCSIPENTRTVSGHSTTGKNIDCSLKGDNAWSSRTPFSYIRRVWFLFVFGFTISELLSATDAYVLQQTGPKESYLHRRLIGRERREIQREFLSILGLSHRPRPVGDPALNIQHESAPLYMLGLYNTVSGFADIFEEKIRREPTPSSDPNYPQKRDSPLNLKQTPSSSVNAAALSSNNYQSDVSYGRSVGPFSDHPLDVHVATNNAWYRYSEAQQVFTNEVGIPEFAPNSQRPTDFMEMQYDANDNGLRTNGLERNLLGNADVVMSISSTNYVNNDDDEAAMRGLLKRHRSFFFNVNQIPTEDSLTAAKFRLYKDISEPIFANITLRVNVYQALQDEDKNFGLYLLGSRLVDGTQEGWLVYDVTSACRDWMDGQENNMGLRVAVETLEGRSINLNKAGIVGRRGDSSKQAFLVGFLSQGHEQLPSRVRNRQRRNAATDGQTSRRRHDKDEDFDTIEDEDSYNNSDDMEEELWDEDEYISNYGVAEDDDTNDPGRDYYADELQTNEFDVGEEQQDSEHKPLKRMRRRGKSKSGKTKKRNRGRDRGTRPPPPVDAGVCRRQGLYVNFQDLRWEGWIIAPAGYRAYRCMGECTFPLSANMNATNHAIVQTLVHLLKPKRLPKPCCVPTKLDAISVLFYDDNNNVVFKMYKNMVVKSCGCQ